MNNLLILGASVLQLPAIKKAKEMGYHVGVVDFNQHAVGIPFADEYFNVSTVDEHRVYETAKSFNAKGVITLATDMPMRSVAYATSKLGLVGISYETAIKATDKGLMMECFDAAGIAHPWYFVVHNISDVDNIASELTFPCICKPTDSSGSRGVVLVNTFDELIDAINYSRLSSVSGSVIIEEYMKGVEVSVEIIVVDGVVNVLQVTDKLTTGAPHFVELGHSQPSNLSNESILDISKLACRAVRAIGIENGPAHVEIMLTDNGPKMIELGARMGGDCITTHLVPLSTGIDMVKATIEISMGEKPDIQPQFNKGACIRYFPFASGVIKDIKYIDKAKQIEGIKEITCVHSVGDSISEISSSADRLGFVISQAYSATEAINICNMALSTVNIERE